MEWVDPVVNVLFYLALVVGGDARVLVFSMLVMMFVDIGTSKLAFKGLVIAIGWGLFFYRVYRDRH